VGAGFTWGAREVLAKEASESEADLVKGKDDIAAHQQAQILTTASEDGTKSTF